MLFVCVGGAKVYAKTTLAVDLSALPSSSEYTTWTWNAGTSTGTFEWTATSYNSTELFGGGDYSAYETLNLVTATGTANHFRVIVKFNNGADQVTINPVSTGEVSITLKNHVTSENLKHVSTIRLSGANDVTGNVYVTSIYLEGPDPLYREVYNLGSPITFETALSRSDPYVLVQNGKVFCGPFSPSDGALTYKDVSEIKNYSWDVLFEQDGETDKYYMKLQKTNGDSEGYVNASVWSHTFLSSVDKEGTKGEQQDGALWTIEETGSGTKKYYIRNVGDVEGSYGDDYKAKGFLGITTDGYWANHVSHDKTSGYWEFYSLDVKNLPTNDPVYYGWDDLTFSDSEKVTKNDETHFVRDANEYAAYWSETAKWRMDTPFDASEYRYLVFYAKRNVVQYGNGESDTGGSVFIKDNSGTTFRGDDYVKYGDPAVNYPAHTGNMWMNRNNEQRATVVDLQWLANSDKYGDGSECKVLDITKIKEFGFSGDFTIGGAFFTNTLPNYSKPGYYDADSYADYKRTVTEEASPEYDKFGTICLQFPAVCCGAQLYTITGKTASGLVLDKYEGVMEAGKPYLYKTLDAKQQYWGNIHPETAVYFYKAGYKQEDTPVEATGLVGTFTDIKAPLNSYVLSSNKLYKVDAADAVTVGANKAYVNDSEIPVLLSRGNFFIDFNEPTGVSEMKVVKTIENQEVYNLAGQRVAQPTKGLYIVNGKKVVIK